MICLVAARYSNKKVFNVNAWYKPFKFAFSTFLYTWAMAWYCHYLVNFNIELFNWANILLLGFEILYIALQASRGQLSHYNNSTPLYATLYSMMAIAASLVSIYATYVGVLFFKHAIPSLPSYYLWSIRLSILLFVVFSFQGFTMGARLNHSVGAINDNSNRFIIGWSKTVGDLRVAHFIGMHALQVLPFLSFYVFNSTIATFLLALLYGALALSSLIQALKGRPVSIKLKHAK
jgi:hypothetical protein